MVNLKGFDAGATEPMKDFEPVPAGKYLAMITESQMKDTKDQKGSYLELTFEVLEGEYKGRKLWARLNLNNSSETAVKIAQSELSSICRAVGVMTPQDSLQLHDIPLTIIVKCRKRADNGEISNEIKGYESRSAQQQQQPAAAGATAPPWKR